MTTGVITLATMAFVPWFIIAALAAVLVQCYRRIESLKKQLKDEIFRVAHFVEEVEHYRKSLEISEKDFKQWMNRAITLEHEQKTMKAQSLDRNRELAEAMAARKRWEDSTRFYEESLESYPWLLNQLRQKKPVGCP